MIKFFKYTPIILLVFGLINFSNQKIENKNTADRSIKNQSLGLNDNDIQILIEDFEENKKHPYYKEFTTNPDPNFIQGLYYLNKSKAQDNRINKITRRKKNQLLIFTLIIDGNKSYDTLVNCVHPKSKKRDSDMGNTIPISGKLTDGIWSNLNNNPKGNTSIKLYLREKSAQTKIDITNLEGDLIENLVDEYLEKGNYSYKWRPNDNHNGKFFMNIYTDKLKMTYLIDVE